MMPADAPVTTVYRRTVRSGSEDCYEEWLAGIAAAAGASRGSLGTTLLRPSAGESEYVAIARFDGAASLAAWLASADRQRWMSRLREIEIRREDVETLPGTEWWFTLPAGAGAPPPRHKTAALVLLGLYPLVLSLDVVLGPLLSALPRPMAQLVSLVVSVSAMVGFVLPLLTRVFHQWLQPRSAGATRA